MRLQRAFCAAAVAACVVTSGANGITDARARTAWPRGTAVVTYANEAALDAALRRGRAQVVRRLPALHAAEVRPAGDVGRFAATVESLPGIERVEPRAVRSTAAEPSLAAVESGPLQWQYAATHTDAVPEDVLRAARSQTIAIVDTGADLAAPDLAAKSPRSYDVRRRSSGVADLNGHGTFVASLAAGSSTNGEGIAGAGGDARLLVVRAGSADGAFSDVEEAAAIVWAVDHGARIVNLSLGGPDTSAVEQRAVDYAVARGALLVAAIGNDHAGGNTLEYPAALLQEPGSNGVGGRGLVVGASTRSGTRASFSTTGSHLSLLAPGESVFGAVSSLSPETRYPRVALPGAHAGLYGYASGTSFAAPQAAGAAALVWAADPTLSAAAVATILEQSASGGGAWTPELGYGVLDAAAAVVRARASTAPGTIRLAARRAGARAFLAWSPVAGAVSYRVASTSPGSAERVLTPAITATSASYPLAPTLSAAFTVTAFDAAGATLAGSAAVQVSTRSIAAPSARRRSSIRS